MLSAAVLLLLTGCAVPQPRGAGRLERVTEPTKGRAYWLYLPQGYTSLEETSRQTRRWPLVMTFHGMKPYDTAHAQALEWQQEADRYGFIVCAPELRAFDFLFGEFPLRRVTSTFEADADAVLAIMDHVFQTTRADPANVLSTSWSSGGYMAHYMLNRHPARFTCLAVRQSNFTEAVLDPGLVSRSRYHPVLILSTRNDFAICKEESRRAIQWYESHGYKNLAWVYLNKLGHERTPDMAADFFAHVCGAIPSRPPEVLVGRQAIDGNASGMALLAGNLTRVERNPESPPPHALVSTATPARSATPPRPLPVPPTDVIAAAAAPARAAPPPSSPSAAGSAGRGTSGPQPLAAAGPLPRPSAPVGISVSSAVGFAPLRLVFSADCPTDWHRTADFLWTLNNQQIGHGVNGQRTINQPGDYTLELLVVTESGAEYRASRAIRVLRDVEVPAAANAYP